MVNGPSDAEATNPALLVPRRNPGLIERVAAAIFKSQPQYGPQPGQQQSTQSGITVQALQTVYDQIFRSQRDRLAVYQDVDEIDDLSEEISVALDTIADNVTTSEDGIQMSFSTASEDPAVAEVIDQVNADAALHTVVYSVVRNLVKYGDSFSEVVVNADGQVTQLRQLPPSTMYRNQDATGDLKLGAPVYEDGSGACRNAGGDCAFEQRAEDTQTMVAAFWPWQIVHIRNNHDGFSPYGRSHLRVARVIWRKLKAIEEAMIIARLARAYPKYRYKVDTTGLSPAEAQDALNRFQLAVNQRQTVAGRREQPYWILSDIFFTAPKVKDGSGKFSENATDVSVLESQGQTVFNIDDVKTYFHRKLLCCLRIPPAHMGWEEQVNARATVSAQDVQYLRFLRRVQQLVGQALEQVYDTALVLAGIDPTTADYEISWPMLSANDESAAADAEFSRAQADEIYAELKAIDAEWIQRHRFDMDDEEIEELEARMEEANQAAAAVAGPDALPPDPNAEQPETLDADEQGDDEGRDQEHEIAAEADLVQNWSAAARESALLHRRAKAAQKATPAAKSRKGSSAPKTKVAPKAKAAPKVKAAVHAPVAGTHTHAHAHGTTVHSHAHVHAGGSAHAHPHAPASNAKRLSARAAGMPRDVRPHAHVPRPVVIAEDEPDEVVEQVPPAPDHRSVTLLAEAIRSRTVSILERDAERVLDEQRRMLQQARGDTEDAA